MQLYFSQFKNSPARMTVGIPGNGQIGKIAGKKPVSKLWLAIAVLIAAAIGAGGWYFLKMHR